MSAPSKRVAINLGSGYVPGLNSVLEGASRAAWELGWEVVGIRDGFDGLLFPDQYPDGGLLRLTPSVIEGLCGATGCVLGTAARLDPFHVRTINADNGVEEIDRSGDVLEGLRRENVAALISVVDAKTLSIALKLQRAGLPTVCIPKSAENQIAATQLSFGFNSALSFTIELLDRARQAAQSARMVGVVEVPGEHAGWLALQSATAVVADAVLIPEIPYDLAKVAEKLRTKLEAGRAHGLIVVAEGAQPATAEAPARASSPVDSLRSSLSPGARGDQSHHVMQRSGQAAERIALELQRLVNHQTYPLVIGPLAKGGAPTVVDRQLGLGFGAGAIRAIDAGQTGTLVAFQPPELRFVPLGEAINRFRTVPADSVFMHIARSLGIVFGN